MRWPPVSDRTTPEPAASRTPGPPGPSRLEWVDVAKGMTILLVVVHHVTLFLAPLGLVPPVLAQLNLALTSLRMPLFFLLSGLFFGATLAGGWRRLWHKRVALFLYLYVLWASVQFGVLALLPPEVVSQEVAQDPGEFARMLLVPSPAMWFLYALAVFSVLARLARPVPPVVQLVLSGVFCALIGSGLVQFESGTWTVMARYLFFFLLGCHARAAVEWLAALTGPRRTAAAVPAAALAVSAAAAIVVGWRTVPGVAFLLNVTAVACAVLLAAWLARWQVGRALAALGRHTLEVYLTNVLWVGLVALALRDVPVPAALQYPLLPLLALLVTGLSLLTWRAALAVRAGWLYTLPERLAYRPPARTAPDVRDPAEAVTVPLATVRG